MILQAIPYAVVAVLVVAAFWESKTGRLPNWLVLIPFALFFIFAGFTTDKAPLFWQIGFAATVFIFGIILFMGQIVGPGAVKLAAGAALFAPLGQFWLLFLAFIIAVVATIVGTGVLRQMVGSDDSQWYVLTKRVIPMSVVIGGTALLSALLT